MAFTSSPDDFEYLNQLSGGQNQPSTIGLTYTSSPDDLNHLQQLANNQNQKNHKHFAEDGYKIPGS